MQLSSPGPTGRPSIAERERLNITVAEYCSSAFADDDGNICGNAPPYLPSHFGGRFSENAFGPSI
jgi:hypothetical protein